MLSRILPKYQVQASEMFQIFYVQNTYTLHQPLGVVTFVFAMHSLDKAFHRSVAPLNLDQYTWLYNIIEAQIQSRFCGLLEVERDCGPINAAFDWASGDGNDGSAVKYIHRIVAEFLVSGEVWEEMSKLKKYYGFNSALNLSSAYLSMLKSVSSITTTSASKTLLNNLIHLLGSSICFDGRVLHKYMKGMEQSMIKQQDNFSHIFGGEAFWDGNWLQNFCPDVEKVISKHNPEPFKVLGKIPYKVGKFGQKAPQVPLNTVYILPPDNTGNPDEGHVNGENHFGIHMFLLLLTWVFHQPLQFPDTWRNKNRTILHQEATDLLADRCRALGRSW